MATIPCVATGPFGGPKGGQWDDGTYSTVRKMIITHGDIVNSITTEYDDNGESKWSKVHGGTGGKPGKPEEVKFDYANNEFLLSISGYYSAYAGNGTIIGSLTITSNKKTYGPYGKTPSGEYFASASINVGKIVGFFGRSGWYLDALGAYIVPKDLITIGSFGGIGGQPFDDGTYTTVKRILVRHGDGFVSIQTVYDNNGVESWSESHGSISGGVVAEVKLDYPNEFLVSISGHLTNDSNDAIVQSLTFESNKNNKFGPYGKAEGKLFSTSSTYGKIRGFFGRSGRYINSIGVHLEPLLEP